MSWLEWLDNELEEIQKLIEQDLDEERDPDYQQYANLKWKIIK